MYLLFARDRSCCRFRHFSLAAARLSRRAAVSAQSMSTFSSLFLELCTGLFSSLGIKIALSPQGVVSFIATCNPVLTLWRLPHSKQAIF